jgi:hypothetical protein
MKKQIFQLILLPALALFAADVELAKQGDDWQLTVDGSPFFVKGIGGQSHLELARECGANAIRTWGHDSPQDALATLDRAHSNGLMVALGFWVQHERHGFDYDNEAAVEEQFEKFKAIVDAVKDHPALLLYGIGNEVEHESTNSKVWNSIGRMAAYVKEVDPNHPTMVSTAHVSREAITNILQCAPDIDSIGVNAYAGAPVVAAQIREYGWQRPYVFTEWGTSGHWEVGKTAWGAPVEPTSTEKAELFRQRYDSAIAGDPGRCLGGFAFLWGVKQERTGTWYSLFDTQGRQTQAVNVLQEKWSGKPADNHAPEIKELSLNCQTVWESIAVPACDKIEARIEARDPDRDDIEYQWLLMRESRATSSGGDYEEKPEEIIVGIENQNEDRVRFTLDEPGNYRLYCYLYDGQNHVSTANIPFQIR